jgi:hypothetical protein
MRYGFGLSPQKYLNEHKNLKKAYTYGKVQETFG